MPAKPRWLLDLPLIIEQLELTHVPVLNRTAIERLFGVRRRQAINLMGIFGGYQTGNAVVIDRVLLSEQLKRINASDQVYCERLRKEALERQIEETRQFRAASRVRIQVPPDVHNRRVIDLPSSVQLFPGRVTIDFCGAEQLLTYLYELAQAAANDFDRFRDTVEQSRVNR